MFFLRSTGIARGVGRSYNGTANRIASHHSMEFLSVASTPYLEFEIAGGEDVEKEESESFRR